MDEHTSQLKE